MVADPSEAKVFRAHAPQGAFENLLCAHKLLANHQQTGDSLVDTIFGLQEQSRLEITKLGSFIKVDNHEAVEAIWRGTRKRSRWSDLSEGDHLRRDG